MNTTTTAHQNSNELDELSYKISGVNCKFWNSNSFTAQSMVDKNDGHILIKMI